MNLKELIKSKGWESQTAAEVVALANAKTVQRVDAQQYTWAGVAVLVGAVNAEILRITLETNNLGWVVHQLGGSGLQLSDPTTQALLQTFVQNPQLTFCTTLAEQGIKMISPWEEAGGVQDVTTQDVQLELDSIAFETNVSTMLQRMSTKFNQAVPQIQNGMLANWEAVVQHFSEV